MNEGIGMELYELQIMQRLPLPVKLEKTKQRIREWYEAYEGAVSVSLSGGKDSMVVLHIARQMYPDIPAVFVNALEYPEIRSFVKGIDNVTWVKPKMSYKQVVERYGYPVVSKEVANRIYKLRNYNLTKEYRHSLLYGSEKGKYGVVPRKWWKLLDAPFGVSSKCCDVLKHRPLNKYHKATGTVAMTGEMAAESRSRQKAYIASGGCNRFELNSPKSTPIGFWREEDVLRYIHENNLDICSIYGKVIYHPPCGFKTTGCSRSGCFPCMYGISLEKKPNRFQQMYYTHPKLFEYVMDGLGQARVLDYISVKYYPEGVQKFYFFNAS